MKYIEIFQHYKGLTENTTGPKVIKVFSCSTQLSTKFQMLSKTKISTSEKVSSF